MTAAAAAAAGCAALAGLLLVEGDSSLGRLARTETTAALRPRPGVAASASRWSAVAAGLLVLLLGSWVLAAAAAVAARTAVWVLARRSAQRRAETVRERVTDLLGALAAELRAGSPPRTALATVCTGAAPAVAEAARRSGGSPVPALAAAAHEPGADALADLAVAWQVVEATGAGLAAAVEALATTARADSAAHRELVAGLAGPRATAALLAGLPTAGVLLGTALGADPVAFLLATATGRACLLGGVLLVAAGTVWTERIAERVELG